MIRPTRPNRTFGFLTALLLALFVSNAASAGLPSDLLLPTSKPFSFAATAELAESLSIVPAGISLTTIGVPYTENFDSLSNVTSVNHPFINDATILGLYGSRTTYLASNGGMNAGSLFSFGTPSSSTERAFGSIAVNSTGDIRYGIRIHNATGSTITSLDISFVGEQWRRGNNAAAHQLTFDYRQAATVIDLEGTYLRVSELDFTSPVNGATAGAALNGNLSANRNSIFQSISVVIPPGEEIMLRWTDVNDEGEDHGLAIDDLSITPQGAVVPTLNIANVSQIEGNAGTTSFDFEVSLTSPAPAGGVTFDIATADGTATDGNAAGEDHDYVARSITGFSIPEGANSATFSVTVNGDTSAEPNESFSILVANISGANTGDLQASGMILNDDTNIYLGDSEYNVDEGAGTLSVVINRDGRGDIPVSAQLASNGGTATSGASCDAGVDFVAVSTTVSFAAGEISKSVPVTICNDDLVEGSETFAISLSAPSGGATVGNPASAPITISEVKSDLPVITLSSGSFVAREGDNVAVVVNRTGNLSGTSSVNYQTSDGTANAGSCPVADYVAGNGTLVFAANESSKTVSIPLCHDSVRETEPETFTLSLGVPQGAILGSPASAAVTIYDVARYENSAMVNIADGGWAMSTIDVSGHQGNAMIMRLYLNNLSMDTADDLEAVLVSPAGTAFVLMADVGGLSPLNSVNLTLQDIGSIAMPDESELSNGGAYKPTSCNAPVTAFPVPGPAGPYIDPGCLGTAAGFYGTFGGESADGTWSLYLRDDAGANVAGTGGTLTGGWALEFIEPTAAAVNLGGLVMRADGIGISGAAVRVEGGDLSAPRLALTNSFGFYNFEGLTAGTTYVVTVASKRYTFAIPSQAITLNDSLDNADFIAEE